MSNKFVGAMRSDGNWKLTENGADTHRSTSSSLVDLFGTIGAFRTRSDEDVLRAFSNAFGEDRLLATKMSFYARNIRSGLGERRVSRAIWKWLAINFTDIMKKNLALVPEFGRWDDLYEFVGTPVEPYMWNLVNSQLREDLHNYKNRKSISLLAKWLKSVNTSSAESVFLGKLTALKLGMSERVYRKTLSMLRTYLNVVEKSMSSNEWVSINYERVPSKAMTNYRKAFSKRDGERFVEYLAKVTKGEAKINSSTLYPYDIVEKVLYKGEKSAVLEEQWKALPNYIEGENNILVMADVSGSMSGRPMATSVGLAMYFAERNKGPFKNVFMTFSAVPEFVTIRGATLYDRIRSVINSKWSMNTDIEAAFRKILDVAIQNRLSQNDLPKSLIIISDMEFDVATNHTTYSYGSGSRTLVKKDYYQTMVELYARSGYNLPKIVFWNVSARNDTFHSELKEGVQFASGQSTSVFKSIIGGAELGAYELMLSVLNDPMYDAVRI
jgi:hypothetical protein